MEKEYKQSADIRLSVIGAGNLGQAITLGLAKSEDFRADQITLTRRDLSRLEELRSLGFTVLTDNVIASTSADIVLVVVEPVQMETVLDEIAHSLDPGRQILVSAVTGFSVKRIKSHLPEGVSVVRVMPNLAASVGNSMTCMFARPEDGQALGIVKTIFDNLGRTLVIAEELLTPATALCASGLAFFLRSIRAAAQGGTEIGFHAEDAIEIAAQTALGAATLLLNSGKHPEENIDKVTTPRGITIAGLNEMEHKGFSSAMIKGIVTSASKVAHLIERE